MVSKATKQSTHTTRKPNVFPNRSPHLFHSMLITFTNKQIITSDKIIHVKSLLPNRTRHLPIHHIRYTHSPLHCRIPQLNHLRRGFGLNSQKPTEIHVTVVHFILVLIVFGWLRHRIYDWIPFIRACGNIDLWFIHHVDHHTTCWYKVKIWQHMIILKRKLVIHSRGYIFL